MARGTEGLILMYHRVAEEKSDPWALCVSPGHFREQLEILKKFCNVMQMRDFICDWSNGDLRRHSVVITFDDGYADVLWNARPIFMELETPATIFLVSGLLGDSREYWSDELEHYLLQPGKLPAVFELEVDQETIKWDLGESANYTETAFLQHQGWKALEEPPTSRHGLFFFLWQRIRPLSDDDRKRVLDKISRWAGVDRKARATHRILSADEVLKISEGGLVEVGSHTHTHPQLSGLSKEAQREEMLHSKLSLEELTGTAVTSFAYPYGWHGDYTPESVLLARESGFTSGCTTIAGAVNRNMDEFQLPRMHVGDWNGEEFEENLRKWFEA
jgi:peptidoglycan/xylan/chitin deacetylase (PgdA/CDA1 family)